MLASSSIVQNYPLLESRARMPTATFAIISDLHCRLSVDSNDSFLTVGGLRRPSGRHPVESLLDLIDKEGITANGLLVPGDLTNKARLEGMSQGWDYLLEIGRKLNVDVIPVIGNHDIDSHPTTPAVHPFYKARNLHRDFPFKNATDVQSFFADGFCLQKVGNAEIIAINTVIDHTDVTSAKRGSFGIDRIEKMERALRTQLSSPLRGALMHHHPLLHSGSFLEDNDVIPTGDALLGALRGLGCSFVIHGHKHFTRLSYNDGIGILAAGSFSAMLHEFATSVSNTFHVMEVEGDNPNNVRGKVRTWVFRFGSGWHRSDATHAGFPFVCGFGRREQLPRIISNVKSLALIEPPATRYRESEVLLAAPDLEYLTPWERDQINESLSHDDLKLADSDEGHLELWRSFRP